MSSQAFFSSHSHADVLELLLDHLLRLRVEEMIYLKLEIFLRLCLLIFTYHLVMSSLDE
jgi:hypothetical protein